MKENKRREEVKCQGGFETALWGGWADWAPETGVSVGYLVLWARPLCILFTAIEEK